jgi:hypothetical protein
MIQFKIYALYILFVVCLLVYKYILRPVLFSPLSNIPTPHWSCHFSPLWYLWTKWSHNENRLVHQNHVAKGRILRLAPGLISLNCFNGGLKEVYLGGFPKTEFYFRGFAIYG